MPITGEILRGTFSKIGDTTNGVFLMGNTQTLTFLILKLLGLYVCI